MHSEFVYPEGDKFVGEFFRDNFKNGTYTSKDGSVYKGEFKAGQKHGMGELEIKGKFKYQG